MAIETILTDEVISRYTKAGLWKNKLWTDYIRENAQRSPSKEAIVDRANRITFQQVKDSVDQTAKERMILEGMCASGREFNGGFRITRKAAFPEI